MTPQTVAPELQNARHALEGRLAELRATMTATIGMTMAAMLP
jgi:hypothetical protein